MRLQLIAALLLGAAPAAAEPDAEATLRVYTDDDDITVVSPSARVGADAGDTSIDVDATVDAVTGASVDVVTSASPLPIDERRLELGLAAERPVIGGLAASALVRGSHENDHDALRLGAGLALELLERRLTVELRYLGGSDRIGTVVDPELRRSRALHQVTFGVTMVLDPRTLLDVVTDAASSSGYHASPYRRVPVLDPALPLPIWLPEEAPRARRSLAAAVRLRRAIGEVWFGAVDYRAYSDDWSMASHTASLAARRTLGDRLLAGALLRGYLQDGAWFYRSTYTGDGAMPPLRTRDRVLGPMRTLFASLTAELALDDDERWRALAAAGVLASWTPDFPLQTDRHALVLTLSLSAPLGGGP